MSGNVGTQIHDIVQNSNNPEWKVNYASVISDNDALSQDIVYHKQCITEQWQLLKCKLECLPSSSSKTSFSDNTESNDSVTTVHFIAAEIEFLLKYRSVSNKVKSYPLMKQKGTIC